MAKLAKAAVIRQTTTIVSIGMGILLEGSQDGERAMVLYLM
jgi:hypothetical protein